ncbi:TolC family protein [Labilibaculum sp. DW002]|uniref:TolC family protein n=1 Tax=Paralabilibaculum antarcticum TaxID=2912572 RepID=A0ABT5VQT7_9BACT|nr:TolC family protein [Labilibaculum sp. DW002]MDE5417162.1 TolC family protein [Labilibaculum sp. DW002]
MKNTFILLLLIFSSFLGRSQQQEDYTIAILGDKLIPENEQILLQLKEEIKSVVGQSANIVFKDSFILLNDLNLEKAKSNYENMVQSDDVDLILSFGSVNNFVIGKNKIFSKPVILFGVINDDFITFPEGQISSNITNLTYILTPQSYKRDLLQFKEIYPFKKIGIIVDDYLTEIYPVKNTLNDIFKTIEAEYVLIPIKQANDVDGKLESLDAVYLSGGLFFNKDEQISLVNKINQKNLPSFTSINEHLSDYGVLLTSQPVNNLEQFFRRIALNIESAVNGDNLAQLPIYMDLQAKLSLNIETAFQINFPLKYSFLLRTNIVGNANQISFQKQYTLPEVFHQVLNQNLNLKAEQKNIELANQEVKLSKSEYLPDLSTSLSGTHLDPELAKVSNGSNPEYSTSGNITFEQLIFSEQASANIKIQKELKEATKETYNAKEKDAILNAGVAFYNALIAKANFLINDENLRVTRQNYEIAQQKYDAGQTGKSDVLRWKSELAMATQNIVNSYTQLNQSFNELNQILNNPIGLKIDVLNSDFKKPGDKDDFKFFNMLDDPFLRERFTHLIEEKAIENAHELKSLQHNISASKRSAMLQQRSKFLPTIGLQGQYNHTFSRDGEGATYPTGITGAPDGYYNVGVQVSLPIFQKNQRNINRQKSFIQRDQLNIQKDETIVSIKRNVNDIILSIVSQFSNIELSKVSTEAAKESLELMQISYSNGAIGITSLIDSQQAYFQAQQQQANADYNFQLSILQLERIMSYFFSLHSDEENQVFVNQVKERIVQMN